MQQQIVKPTAALSGPEEADEAPASGSVDLPLDATEKVLSYVSPLESVRLAAVCKAWAAAVSERLARVPAAPHLFALEYVPEEDLAEDYDQRLVEFGLRLSEHNRGAILPLPIVDDEGEGKDSDSPVIPARLPGMVGNEDVDLIDGALSSSRLAFYECRTGRVVVVNPVTCAFESISTSSGTADPYEWFWRRRAVVVIAAGADAFFVGNQCKDLSIWRRSDDGEGWSQSNLVLPADYENGGIGLAAFSDGVFYLLHDEGHMFAVDTRAPPPLTATKLPVPSIDVDQYDDGHLLVSDNGEVLFVGMELTPEGTGAVCGPGGTPRFVDAVAGFEVYRLDTEELRWVKLETLMLAAGGGGMSLFLSKRSSFAVRASETPGCRSDCIYFLGDEEPWRSSRDDGWGGADCYSTFGVYSMEEQRVVLHRAVGTRCFLPNIALRPA